MLHDFTITTRSTFYLARDQIDNHAASRLSRADRFLAKPVSPCRGLARLEGRICFTAAIPTRHGQWCLLMLNCSFHPFLCSGPDLWCFMIRNGQTIPPSHRLTTRISHVSNALASCLVPTLPTCLSFCLVSSTQPNGDHLSSPSPSATEVNMLQHPTHTHAHTHWAANVFFSKYV